MKNRYLQLLLFLLVVSPFCTGSHLKNQISRRGIPVWRGSNIQDEEIEASCAQISSIGGSRCFSKDCEGFMDGIVSLNHRGLVDETSRGNLIKRIWFAEGDEFEELGIQSCINAVIIKTRSLGLLKFPANQVVEPRCDDLENRTPHCLQSDCERILRTIKVAGGSETEAQLRRRHVSIFGDMIQMWGYDYLDFADCQYAFLDIAKAAGIYQVAKVQGSSGNYTFTLL